MTSIEKRVGDALYNCCEKFLNGELTYADLEVLGVADGMIDYVDNDNFKKNLSEDARAYVADVAAKIASGEIVVASGLKRYTSTSDLNALFDEMDPTK